MGTNAVVLALGAVAVLILVRIAQARKQHAELMGLLNDLATMVGEWFDQQDKM
jgi:hypothetical protein